MRNNYKPSLVDAKNIKQFFLNYLLEKNKKEKE